MLTAFKIWERKRIHNSEMIFLRTKI